MFCHIDLAEARRRGDRQHADRPSCIGDRYQLPVRGSGNVGRLLLSNGAWWVRGLPWRLPGWRSRWRVSCAAEISVDGAGVPVSANAGAASAEVTAKAEIAMPTRAAIRRVPRSEYSEFMMTYLD